MVTRDGHLRLDAVSLLMDGEPALDEVSLAIGREMVAALGAPGSGKTALLRLASGAVGPTSGSAGRPERVALVPEEPQPSAATPQNRLKERLHKTGLPREDLARLLDAYGLWEVRGKPGNRLSRAHAVALSLAAAQAEMPDLLLIDCALDGLDPAVCPRVLAELTRMTRLGCAVIFATRRLDLAASAPRVCILERGRICADGAPADLVARLGADTVEVEMEDPLGVVSLIEPWEVRVEPAEGGLRFTTPDGLGRTAKLLRDGYGTVRTVLLRPATLADVWDRVRGR